MAMTLIMVSMLISVAYLKYAMSASVAQKYRFEEINAFYMAETGINLEAIPVLPKLTMATLVVAGDVSYSNKGFYNSVYCSTYVDQIGQTNYFATGNGVSIFNNTLGAPIRIERQVEVRMVPDNMANFMYFTNSEEPGGGPGLGSYVSFGGSDVLEGKVFTNGTMQMSQYGCPDFTDAEVSAVGGINYGNCDEEQWAGVDDEADSIRYPIKEPQELAINNANYVFTADDLLWRSSQKDSLIMTEIEFVDNGFKVKQWSYVIPPVSAGPPPISFRWDMDIDAGNLNNGRIAFNAPWDTSSNVYFMNEIYVDDEDMNGDGIIDVLDQFNVGDTISVSSPNPDSTKFWSGEINDISISATGVTIFVSSLEQSFSNGFVDAEEVSLAVLAGVDNSVPFNNFAYYHNHPDASWGICNVDGFHHFDFEPPPGGPDVMAETMFYEDHPTVIYVRNGQVRVKGIVDGQFTIVTDNYTEYRRSDDLTRWDRVWDNIWIMDDLIYEDSDPASGEVIYGTRNRLGLFSGANVILANTMANGGRNSLFGEDLVVNGALLANFGSVVVQYWQNTISNTGLSGPNFANPSTSLGDGRGPRRNPNNIVPSYTGAIDFRGIFRFWGSMIQNKRGYMKRNAPGPYSIPLPGIGYDKDYHYDYNFIDFSPPPYFPPAVYEDGSMKLRMKAYGEIPMNKNKDLTK